MNFNSVSSRKIKISFLICMLFNLSIFYMGVASAKEKVLPCVNWSPNLFTIAAQNTAIDTVMQQQIIAAISERLHSLRDQGDLPFSLKEVNEEYNIENGNMSEEIALIALVVDQNTLDSQYYVKKDIYYKSLVLCGIDIIFCSADEETNSMRILHTIPLRGYDVIGSDIYNPVKSPITNEQKSKMFVQIAKSLIFNDLSFKKAKAILENVEVNQVIPETYQVTEVNISSPLANKVFQNQIPHIKSLIGGVFTSKFQQSKHRVVYPALPGGAWEKDASNNLYSLQLASPSSAMKLTMKVAKYPIKLELTGLAAQEIKTQKPSAVKYDIGYKAWLKKTPIYGKEQEELTKVITRQFSKRNTIKLDDDDIFTELLIGLSTDLAEQKE